MLKDALSRMVKVFSPAVLMQGEEYQQKGFVLNIRFSEGLLKARVKDLSGHIYDVHMDLRSWPDKPAHCTCPQQQNCKHAAASLFAQCAKENPGHLNEVPRNSHFQLGLQNFNKSPPPKKLSAQQIIYLLQFQRNPFEDKLVIQLGLVKLLKSGAKGKIKVFNQLNDDKKQYCTHEDEDIIAALLLKSHTPNIFDCFYLRNTELLKQILATRRAYLVSEQDYLQLGEDVSIDFMWTVLPTGEQKIVLKKEEEQVQPLYLDKPWFYDEDILELSLINTDYSSSQLRQILSTPPVALPQLAEFCVAWSHQFPELPLPQCYQPIPLKISPRFVIYFDAVSLPHISENAYRFYVSFAFIYHGYPVQPHDKMEYIYQNMDEHLYLIQRDFTKENEFITEFNSILKTRAALAEEIQNAPKNFTLSQAQILIDYHTISDLNFLYQQWIPLLQKKGWEIEYLNPIYQEIIWEDDVEWYADIQEKGEDFFSYELGISIQGKTISLVPLILALLKKMDRTALENMADEELLKLELGSGKYLEMRYQRIKPVVQFLLHYGYTQMVAEDKLSLQRYHFSLLQETEQALIATRLRWRSGEHLKHQMEQLLQAELFAAVSLPIGLKTKLRDYQLEGLSWLQMLRRYQFGGILADDMGLGKTIQTLAHLQLEKENGRMHRATLIIAPTSLITNWAAEAKRFTPELKFLVYHGSERHSDDFDHYDVVCSSYGLIQRDKNKFTQYPFYYLILDEAQFIKNARTKTTQIIQQITAQHRLCLSGTPLENHLGELWSLFHFLMPGLLGDYAQFKRFYRGPIENEGNIERNTHLIARIKPFMLRRSKNQVARELPAKTEILQRIEIQGPQRDLYEAIRLTMEKKVQKAILKQGIAKSHIILLDALLKLRQVCCDPRLLSLPAAKMAYGTSAKMEALLELLNNLIAEKRRILIFSQFTSMLALIEEEIKKHRYSYLKLTGQTVNRQQIVQEFQEGDIPIFLISLKAGGTGLNLTKADTVIHFDPWWNPAAEDQATDRSHRIGQENPVFVYKLITEGTVEEAILAMQVRKKQISEAVLSQQSKLLTKLTLEDIEEFFQPLSNEE